MRLTIEPDDVVYFVGAYEEHNLGFSEGTLKVTIRLTEEQISKLTDDLTLVKKLILGSKQ